MTFCLDAKIIKPVGENINNVVILLHGYGGDGNDIAALTINWKRFLPNTLFICPNGPEKCSINPMGYEWFDLNTEDEKYITEKALESEKILKKFIEEIKTKYNLPFNFLSDEDKEVAKRFGANGMFTPKRMTFVIDEYGKIEKIYKKVNINTHAETILKDLTS